MAREAFGNRFTFIAAGIGMAVGAGNIWRFPRIVAEYGGGTFLLLLLLANLVWAIPLLATETLIGRKTQLGTIGAVRDIMGRRYAWIGAWIGVVTLGILFYYTVVAGWGFRYLTYSVTGTVGSGVDSQALWDNFTGNPVQTILFQAIAVIFMVFIVYRGLKGGIEKVLQITIPALFVVLTVLTIRAVTLPGAIDGLQFLFVPEWGRLGSAEVWLQAFIQMAFSTGAGWGLLLTYAVYTRDRDDITLNASAVVFGNLFASLLAGTTILCTVYALSSGSGSASETLGGGSSSGLAFISLVTLFGTMPGGTFFSSLFFLAFSLATISTLISFFELGIMNLVNMGLTRGRAVIGLGAVAFILGVPSAYSVTFLNNQDFVWGVGLLVSGALVSVVIMRYGVERARTEINASSDLQLGRWWSWCIRAVPVIFAAMFIWWIYQTVTTLAPDSWWNPVATFSTATLLLQWLILFVILYALNNFLANKVKRGQMSESVNISSTDSEEPESEPKVSGGEQL